MSPSEDDIKTLQLGAVAEGVEVVAAYAEAAFDFAVDRDEAALEIALRSMVAGANHTLGCWREMQQLSNLAARSQQMEAA